MNTILNEPHVKNTLYRSLRLTVTTSASPRSSSSISSSLSRKFSWRSLPLSSSISRTDGARTSMTSSSKAMTTTTMTAERTRMTRTTCAGITPKKSNNRLFGTTATALEPPEKEHDIIDYFDILGIDKKFNVSHQEIKSKYKSLMREFHPDRHHHVRFSSQLPSHGNDTSFVETMAANVTRAHQVLMSPLLRSLHLLELKGASIDEKDKSLVDNHFLLEMMELHDEIENTSLDNELKSMLLSCRNELNHIYNELKMAFENDKLDDAKLWTAKLRYWNRIEENISNKITCVETR